MADALGLLLLMAERSDKSCPRAAAKWLGKLALERGVDVDEIAAVAVALAILPRSPGPARAVLVKICARHGVEAVGLDREM